MTALHLTRPIRSLTLKLTLAFLVVGLIGALLVAVLTGIRTRTDFDQYVLTRDQSALVEALGSYYTTHSTWQGVEQIFATNPQLERASHDLGLLDSQRRVVIGRGSFRPGDELPEAVLAHAQPISIDDQVVGYVLLQADRPFPPPLGGADFVQRLTWVAIASAIAASLVALLFGTLLARTLTRPVRALTAATQAMARGQFDQRVDVHSQDEIGQLATAFNQMSADLGQASRTRRQMTADLAHDLRTPLSVLRGYTEGLRDGRLAGSSALFEIMHGEVLHLQRLVDDLRLLSLADAGALTLNRRRVDPAALLERAGLAHIDRAEQQGVALRLDVPEGLPSVEVDTDRMAQVLNNLVENALRHTHSGEVVLGATVDPGDSAGTDKSSGLGEVSLWVRDTGSGIAAEELPFIFDRFYRADPSRQRAEAGGSGLGLAIARAIVEAHGGKMTVRSELGQGTTMSVVLAAVGTPERADADESAGVLGH